LRPEVRDDLTGGTGLSAGGERGSVPLRGRRKLGRGPKLGPGQNGSPRPFFIFSFVSPFFFLFLFYLFITFDFDIQMKSNQLVNFSKIQH
jgi:hypothetical protein